MTSSVASRPAGRSLVPNPFSCATMAPTGHSRAGELESRGVHSTLHRERPAGAQCAAIPRFYPLDTLVLPCQKRSEPSGKLGLAGYTFDRSVTYTLHNGARP